MHFPRTGSANHLDDLAARSAADNRVVDQHNALFRKNALDRVQLDLHAKMPDRLRRLDERTPDIVISDQSKSDRQLRLFGVTDGRTDPRVGNRNNDIRRSLGWGDRTVFLYAGAHGRANAVHQLVGAASRLRHRRDLLIVTAGDGPERTACEQRARDAGLDNIVFLGGVAKERMPDLVNAADVGVAVLQDNPTFKTVYPNKVFDYTAKGNLVAVISNGTAVLGLGNLGALAAKPVMEGKSVLFKRFADIDAIDLEVDTEDVDAFVECVRLLGPTFGGINLEDIKAPGCFIIEQRLRECMDIPVFHDDQHGTAIIAAAGLINALDLTGRSLQDVRLVINGAGAASIACVELLKAMGLPHDHAIICDTKGVIFRGRDGINQWKSAHAVETDARTLADALSGADAFFEIMMWSGGEFYPFPSGDGGG